MTFTYTIVGIKGQEYTIDNVEEVRHSENDNGDSVVEVFSEYGTHTEFMLDVIQTYSVKP